MPDATPIDSVQMRAILAGEMPYPPETEEHRVVRLAEEESRRLEEEKRETERTMQIAIDHEKLWCKTCPAIYRATDIDQLPDPKTTLRVTAWEYGPKGLLLHGESRTGKTRSAWLLLRRLFDEKRSIMAWDGIGWFFEVGRAFRDIEHADKWLSIIAKVDVLFLDDIFRGRMTDAQDMALWGVIERRMSSGKPCIVTTNATGETLEARCGPSVIPIIARLRECCEAVTFKTAMEGR
jgi:DNA replication protein DnaC